MKTILITGASSGIGWATAEKMSQLGHRIVLCGRREERLLELQKKLKTPTHLCCFDISDRVAVFQNIERLPKAFQPIDVLINNAGNAHGLDLSQEAHLDDWDAMIDSNVKGLLYVTKAILPQMIARQAGQIINVGSIAGKEAYPKGNVYCASKARIAAVDSFTQGLSSCIMVGYQQPWFAHWSNSSWFGDETEFSEVRFKGDKQRAELVYNDIEALSAADVAESIALSN